MNKKEMDKRDGYISYTKNGQVWYKPTRGNSPIFRKDDGVSKEQSPSCEIACSYIRMCNCKKHWIVSCFSKISNSGISKHVPGLPRWFANECLGYCVLDTREEAIAACEQFMDKLRNLYPTEGVENIKENK